MAEVFSFLDPLFKGNSEIKGDFVPRIPGVLTAREKEEALKALSESHQKAAERLGFRKTYHAEQIHGADIAVISHSSPRWQDGVDGLITEEAGILLGIHVADCGALYLVDQKTKALGLLHSGKKGTSLNITGAAIEKMREHFGTDPSDLVGVLAPCIRPPHYEIDFAAQIYEQALQAGVRKEHFHDCGLCTASDLKSFYSYRLEKGHTGRMLALLGRHAL